MSCSTNIFDEALAHRGAGQQEDSAYSTGSYSPTRGAPPDATYFPQSNYFPPPPTQPADPNYPPYNPYNPAQYDPPPNAPYNPANYAPHNNGKSTGYTPPPVNPEPGNPYAPPDQRNRRPDDHVSASFDPEHTDRGGSRLSPDHDSDIANSCPSTEHVKSPLTAPSPVQPTKTVQFDLTPRELSPSGSEDESRQKDRDRHKRKREDKDNRGRHRDRDSDGSGRRRRNGSADSAASDETIELPPRFDDFGRPREDDPLAAKLEKVLSNLLA